MPDLIATNSAASIISLALSDLGVIRPGETPSATVQIDCLIRLNLRMAAHSIEQLMAQTQVHQVFGLVPGNGRYTLGVNGSFSTAARAEKLTGWRAFSGGFSTSGPVLTFEELQAASRDNLGSTSSIPAAVGADMAYPLINVGVFPTPSATPGQIELSFWTAVTQFADLTTPYVLPDGWEDFLHFDLAMALLPRYGRQGFDPTVLAGNAQTSKAKIADLNRSAQPAPQAAQ